MTAACPACITLLLAWGLIVSALAKDSGGYGPGNSEGTVMCGMLLIGFIGGTIYLFNRSVNNEGYPDSWDDD